MGDWYDKSGTPATRAALSSANIRTEFALVDTAMQSLPTFTGNANKFCMVNSAGTALESVDAVVSVATTGNGLKITASSLTTGSVLQLVSDTSDSGTRSLAFINNEDSSATGAVGLRIKQDSTAKALVIANASTDNFTVDNAGLVIAAGKVQSNPAPTTGDDLCNKTYTDALVVGLTEYVAVAGDTMTGLLTMNQASNAGSLLFTTAAQTTANVISVTNADSLTTGSILNLASASTDASTRYLVDIKNSGAGSTGAQCLRLNQDINATTMTIDTESTTANVIQISATEVTTGTVLNIPSADSLTTGTMLSLVSNSSDASSRNLALIRNQNTSATDTTALFIQQDAAERALVIDQNADGNALVIDTDATTLSAISIPDPKMTAGNVIDVPSSDSLTTGTIANFTSNSSDVTTRTLLKIHNDNALATGARCLNLVQDADNSFLNFSGASTGADTTSARSTYTTSGSTTHHLQIEVNGTKAWVAVSTNDPTA